MDLVCVLEAQLRNNGSIIELIIVDTPIITAIIGSFMKLLMVSSVCSTTSASSSSTLFMTPAQLSKND